MLSLLTMKKPLSIVFVCHGNICRSVAAEMIFKQMLREKGIEGVSVCSRATSREEIGHDIYSPMKRALARKGIKYDYHQARQISLQDYEKADHVFYMDDMNRRNLDYMIRDYKHIIQPIFAYTPSVNEIEDPWYTDRFDLVVDQITRCLEDILEALS